MRTSARPTGFMGVLAAGVTALVLAGCTSAGTEPPSAEPTGGDASASVSVPGTTNSDSGPPDGSVSEGATGNSGDVTQVTTPAPASSGPVSGSVTGSAAGSGGSGASSTNVPTDGADANRALLKAAGTALDTVPDSTVISIEPERNGTQWEVQVITADGTEHEVELSADGVTVLSGPTAKQESVSDKAKHRDRVAAAKLDYRAAVDKLAEVMPGGRISELDLDSENGRTVWESDVYDSSGAKHELSIDAATGELVKSD